MNVQLNENLFGNSGHLETTTLSQSMFSALDFTQVMRPDSDLSSSSTQRSLYDDRQASAPGDFERTLNQRIDSLEQREQAPAEKNPDPSPRADLAARSNDRPIHRNEEPQETRRSDPSPAADKALESERASQGQNKPSTESGEPRSTKATRKESVSQPREGAKSQAPQGPLETKLPVDLPAHAVMMVTEKSSQTRATHVKSNPGETVGNSAETSDKTSLLTSLQSREQGHGHRGVLNSEMPLKQGPKELTSDPSTHGPVKTQIKTPFQSPVSKSAGINSGAQVSGVGHLAPKEAAAELLSVSKNQAGEMPQSAKASSTGSVEVSTAQSRPGAAAPEMNFKGESGQGAQDEKEMLRPAEGAKPAAQAQSSSAGGGRLDLEALKLQTLANPQRVVAAAKQQPDEVTETNKTQPYEGLDDLSLRKSQAGGGRAESAPQYVSGKRSKFTPSLTPTPAMSAMAAAPATAAAHTLETGSKQSTVMPGIGTATTPGSALVSSPGNTPLSETPLTRAATVKGTDAPLEALSAKDNSPSVSKQIMESIHSSVQQGQKRLTIALHPAELGRVVVKLEEANGQLSGLLEVSQKQTRADIERALPGILQSLQNSGVQIKRLDVTLDNSGRDSGSRDSAWNEPSSDSSSSHQSRQGRQGHHDTASEGPADYAEEGFAGATRTPGYEQSPRPQFAGSASIDLLV